jgi:hypothetical protein
MIERMIKVKMTNSYKQNRRRLMPDSRSGMSKQPAIAIGDLLDMSNNQQIRY